MNRSRTATRPQEQRMFLRWAWWSGGSRRGGGAPSGGLVVCVKQGSCLLGVEVSGQELEV